MKTSPSEARTLVGVLALMAACNTRRTHAQLLMGAGAWGGNSERDLGDGTSNQENFPELVRSLTSGVSVLGGGNYFSLPLQNDAVCSWSQNEIGHLGNSTPKDSDTPVQLDATNLTNIVAIAAGDASSYAPPATAARGGTARCRRWLEPMSFLSVRRASHWRSTRMPV